MHPCQSCQARSGVRMACDVPGFRQPATAPSAKTCPQDMRVRLTILGVALKGNQAVSTDCWVSLVWRPTRMEPLVWLCIWSWRQIEHLGFSLQVGLRRKTTYPPTPCLVFFGCGILWAMASSCRKTQTKQHMPEKGWQRWVCMLNCDLHF